MAVVDEVLSDPPHVLTDTAGVLEPAVYLTRILDAFRGAGRSRGSGDVEGWYRYSAERCYSALGSGLKCGDLECRHSCVSCASNEDAEVRILYFSTVDSLRCVRDSKVRFFHPIHGTAMTQSETSHS